MSDSNAYGQLRAALEESDQLARAGEVVGYESAYRILRRAVVQVIDQRPQSVPLPACHPGDCAPTLPPPDGEGVKHVRLCEHGRVHVWEDGWRALQHTAERDVR